MEGNIAEQRNYQALKAKLEVHKAAGVVGIDVGKAKHFAAVLDPVGQNIQPPFSFSNDRAWEFGMNEVCEGSSSERGFLSVASKYYGCTLSRRILCRLYTWRPRAEAFGRLQIRRAQISIRLL